MDPTPLGPLLAALLSGALLGLAGGLSPGPLTTLVIGQTLRFGSREGVKVAMAPLVTDGPLLLLSWAMVGALSQLELALPLLSLVGAVVLLWLAWETARASAPDLSASEQAPRSVLRGVLVNLVNPHPYLFWFTVGGPVFVRALDEGAAPAFGFLLGFFGLLVGCKVAMALGVSRLQRWLSGPRWRWTMRLLGLSLAVFALGFVWSGVRGLAHLL